MKRRRLIAKTIPIALVLGLVTALSSTAQAQPPIVSPHQVAPDYDPLSGITQAQHDGILNYVLRTLDGRQTLPGRGTQADSGALGGTSETFVDVRADGSYYDPSLGQRFFIIDGRPA